MMTSGRSLFLASLLAVASTAGCATQAVAPTPQPPNPVDPGDDNLPAAQTFEGTYRVESQLNLVAGLPAGTFKDVVTTIIDLTDDDDDPSLFLLNLLASQVTDQTAREWLTLSAAVVGGIVNDLLKDNLPDEFGMVLDIGQGFGEASQKFGLLSQLEIRKSGSEFKAKHTVSGIFFKFDGDTRVELPFEDVGIPDVVVDNIPVTQGTGRVSIGEHTVTFNYGKVLLYAFNHRILEELTGYDNLADFLIENLVDCDMIKEAINEEMGEPIFGSIVGGVCKVGIKAGLGILTAKLTTMDGTQFQFKIKGDARFADQNGDRKADKIQSGLWEGTLTVAGNAGTLTRGDQKFVGERVQ